MEMKGPSPGMRQYYVAVGTADAKLATLVEFLQALTVDGRLALAIACSSRDSVDAVVQALAGAGNTFSLAVLHSDLEPHEAEQQVMRVKKRLQPAGQEPQQQQHTQEVQQYVPNVGLQQQQYTVQQPLQQLVAATQTGQPAAVAAAQGAVNNVSPAGPPDPQAARLGSTDAAGQHDATDSTADSRSLVLVASDACMKGLSRGLLPIGLPLLIQYDLPSNKDMLSRRLAAVFGSSKERGRRTGRQVVIDFISAGEVSAFRARERLTSAPVLEVPVHVPDIFN